MMGGDEEDGSWVRMRRCCGGRRRLTCTASMISGPTTPWMMAPMTSPAAAERSGPKGPKPATPICDAPPGTGSGGSTGAGTGQSPVPRRAQMASTSATDMPVAAAVVNTAADDVTARSPVPTPTLALWVAPSSARACDTADAKRTDMWSAVSGEEAASAPAAPLSSPLPAGRLATPGLAKSSGALAFPVTARRWHCM